MTVFKLYCTGLRSRDRSYLYIFSDFYKVLFKFFYSDRTPDRSSVNFSN